MSLRKRLLQDEDELVVFGGGYTGFSDAAFFAKHGVSVLIIDIDQGKVTDINAGLAPYPEIESWLGFDMQPFTKLVRATTDWQEALQGNHPVVLVCVPTERNGNTWDGPLRDVCVKIRKMSPTPLVIVESTLTPGWTETLIRPILGERVPVAIAPRRDWFTLTGYSLETLDRVVGATDKGALDQACDVLSIVSGPIHRASSYRVSEMVKSVENAYRNLGISFAYQLSLAYPSTDIREVLELAATKFNMDLYYPSIGTAGYCVPISPEYVLSGAEDQEPLSLMREAEKINYGMPRIIAHQLSQRGFKNVCILGLAYKGNLKVHVASASLRLAKALQERGVQVTMNDPLYTDEEIRSITGCEPVPFPEGMMGHDCVVLACDHNQYTAVPKAKLYESLKDVRLILDAYGLWKPLSERFRAMRLPYHAVGDSGWLI